MTTGRTLLQGDCFPRQPLASGDYAMPVYADFAVLKLDHESESEVAQAGFFDESWKLAGK